LSFFGYLFLLLLKYPLWLRLITVLLEGIILAFLLLSFKRAYSYDPYLLLISRNFALIPKEIQRKIKNLRILLIGCGLSSQIAILAARLGCQNFILCDGDRVEASNLNRQAFSICDLGKNKAKVLKRKILEINPSAKIKVVSEFLEDKSKARALIKESDVVINSADPTEIMYQINKIAQKEGKLLFFPLNLGFTSFVLVFTKDSFSLESTVGGRFFGNEFYLRLINATLGRLPSELEIINQRYGKEILQGTLPSPQIALTTYLTSILCINLLIKWLKGEKISVAPRPCVFSL
jgi:Mor family transcriptional regulator